MSVWFVAASQLSRKTARPRAASFMASRFVSVLVRMGRIQQFYLKPSDG